MKLYFVTGNKNKFEEAKRIIPNLQQLDIDLPEIQELDSKKVVENKLTSISTKDKANFVVEDNSLEIDGMNGLPGPLIKWFLKSVGNNGLLNMSSVFGNKAKAKVILGLLEDKNKVTFYEGIIEGEIVQPKGNNGFGWDEIFLPKGSEKTFAEMGIEEKNIYSMRGIAFKKLKEHLYR